MDALFCYAGFLRLYRLSFAEVLNEKVQFVKEKSGFQRICVNCHVSQFIIRENEFVVGK